MTDEPANSRGKIYLVPTPIGNMGDVSPRVTETLESAALIACEDTRTSGRLLSKLGLKKKLVSYHEFNERDRAEQLLNSALQGDDIAVVTDAGAPGISDPAYRIVRAAIDAGVEVVALPGPTSIIPALTASGLPTDRFFFEGFLPNKSAARQKRLSALAEYEHTLVFFESPHRVHKAVTDMLDVLGDRRACVAREISKKFEEYLRGSLSELVDVTAKRSLKGEMVIVVEGVPKKRKGSDD
ncbi:16S rRNA (cytidine(1402)-2'-O)-methyltransferase [candidate division GN15 bacterium]|nr:16S rRNA (cytidine(1402)-2'-O)-methyltransferase [candidate division GN15 bacterium]